MLLKMRGLPPKTQANPDDGVLAAVEGSDEAAIRWFNTIKVSSESCPDHLSNGTSGYLGRRLKSLLN